MDLLLRSRMRCSTEKKHQNVYPKEKVKDSTGKKHQTMEPKEKVKDSTGKKHQNMEPKEKGNESLTISQEPTEKVKESLTVLQEKLHLFNEVKTNCEQAAEHIKVQSGNTERKIKELFENLHQFLQEEEEARITALKAEEDQKSQVIKEKIEGLNREISTISNKIRGIEKELRAEHISPPQKHKATVQLTLQEPQPVSGALINEVKHLGNLTFRVWEKMKDIVSYTPVILDPNTACPEYVLSDDLTGVRRDDDEQQLPDNPERFDQYGYVLGSEGFTSGTHSWEVEVGDNRCWSVGVLAESFQRKGDEGGSYWRIGLDDGEYRVASRPAGSSTGSATFLSVNDKPRRVRFQLDWKKKKLSISDPDADAHLHTFTHKSTDTLFPFLYNGDDTVPLKILPR